MRALSLPELIFLNHLRKREAMAGEIRDAMAKLKAAREKMVSNLTHEVEAVIGEIESTHVDGIDALKLPRAELAQYRAEVQEIRSEFAGLTNGGPPSPLPASSPASEPPAPFKGFGPNSLSETAR